MGKNKGKKKQGAQPAAGQQPAAAQQSAAAQQPAAQQPAAQQPEPGPSRGGSQPAGGGDQPKKGKGAQHETPSQGTQGGPRPGPHGDQPKRGKKGPSQEQPQRLHQQEQSGPQQGQQRRQESAAPQQQRGGHPSQEQRQPPPQQGGGRQQPPHQGGGRQPPPQQGGGHQPPPQQGGGRQPPQQQGGGRQPPQQQGGGRQPPQQQGGGRQPPQQQGGGRQPPQQQGGGRQPPPQQRDGQPSQHQQQPWQQQSQPQQVAQPQPQRGPVWGGQQAGGPQQARGPPQGPQAFPPGFQPAQGPPPGQQIGRGPQGPPPQVAPPSQQATRAPPPQKAGQQPPRSSPRSSAPVESATAGVSELSISKRGPIDRGDAEYVSQTKRLPGKKGRLIKVESNHLQLNLGKLKTAYHYDVNIVPDKPKKFMREVVELFRRKYFPTRWPAFDGMKNIYTASPLTDNLNDFFEDEIGLMEEGRERKFKIEVKFANKVDLTPLSNLLQNPVTPQEAIQVVDIVLRMAPIQSCFPLGRSFFVKPDRIIDLGQGMEMYHGFYQSAIRGWKPLLNVDVAHKAFPKDINVVDALVELISNPRQEFRRETLQRLDRLQEETLFNYIKTLRVNYEIPDQPGSRKTYRVNGLGDPAQVAKFKHENREITVVEYFNRVKNCRLRYPALPTLWVGNPQREDKILLPLELCYICEGQALMRKMTDQQTSKMIRHAATDTSTRKNKIMQGIQRANYNVNNCVKEFGFSVGNEFQKLDARVLTPPDLLYKNKTVRVSRGVWRNETFLNGVTINKWTIVSVCRYPPRPDEYRRMTEMFEREGRTCGMNFASRAAEPFQSIGGRQGYSDIEAYFKSQKGNNYDVIFVIVPESGPQYSYVKKAAEIAVGCLTQCIKSNTVGRKMNQQTAVNILLKVNSKLNGINHTFAPQVKPPILKRPVMIMGADVTHPGPDSKNIPSVAAVTASHDPKAFQYNICWRLQNPKVEIISDLEAIMIEHLKFFYSKTKVKPEAIVFFRDGVSEGQFKQVRDAEIRAIRSACKKLQADGYEPKITFLVVQKRHHTRLFPMNPRDSEDKNCNVPAGTCVDTEIVHPFLQDFYLVSHASIQGVAKPTKYCTLWDDNDMDNDQVEELAYYLCHMFSRCNRSVSYPAPTYYAHLAAARAKVYIENDRLNMDRLRQEFERFQIRDEIRKDLPMFFV